MKECQPIPLEELKKIFLDTLKDLDRFCTENNIRYYIGCGTLIGAVRHQGFIPWDDDLDVFMPQPDYERFCKEYKSERYEIINCYNDLSHPFPFGLLCDKMTYGKCGKFVTHGCGIDVYIINGAPNTKEERVQHMNDVFRYINRYVKLRHFRNGLARRSLWPFKTLNWSLLNKTVRRAVREFEKYKFDDCEYIWPYGGGRLNLKKELYGSPVRLKFEDGEFCAPEYYHEVLTAGYGDYMQLPPEDKRHPYHSSNFYWKEQ